MGQGKLSKEELNDLMKKTKYSKEDIDRLTKDYKQYSVGADKKLGFTESEFIDFFNIRFKEWDKESMKKMFKAFDTDSNGTIDLKEFTTALYLMTRAPATEKLGILFDIFDEDKSGKLSENEVNTMVKVACNCSTTLGLYSYENVDYAYSLFRDVYNSNGGLTKDEFVSKASRSDKFIKMICFYDTVGNLLY